MTLSWVDGLSEDASFLTERPDSLQRTIKMRPRLGVDRNDIGTGRGKIREIRIDRGDHQVDVEDFLRGAADGFNDGRAVSDIRNKVTVHHVAMYPVGSRGVHGSDLIAELAEISRQNRRGDQERARH